MADVDPESYKSISLVTSSVHAKFPSLDKSYMRRNCVISTSSTVINGNSDIIARCIANASQLSLFVGRRDTRMGPETNEQEGMYEVNKKAARVDMVKAASYGSD